MSGHRTARVAHALQAEIGALLLRDVRDPRLRQVTITDVRVSPDLRQARVFFRTLDPGDRAHAETGLARAQAFLRSAVGRALGLRVTPELRFEWDEALDVARRMEDVLRGLDDDGPPEGESS